MKGGIGCLLDPSWLWLSSRVDAVVDMDMDMAVWWWQVAQCAWSRVVQTKWLYGDAGVVVVSASGNEKPQG